jgi:hypothetical protein
MNDAAELDQPAVLLRLHTGLEGLVSGIGQNDPDDDIPATTCAEHAGHLRKMLASLAAQLFSA